MGVLDRMNVRLEGRADRPAMVFAHGFGCAQEMWRHVWPAFAEDHRVVLYDLVGAGDSDLSAWSPRRYASLQGHADDLLELCDALDLEDVVFVGHSVSAMIGVLAAKARPALFDRLVLVSPSPRYTDDDGYTGGMPEAAVEDLLTTMDANYLGWSSAMAPVIVGNPDRPQLGEELTASFCRTDPRIASHFARVTFTSDNRADLPEVEVPTLVLQCQEDAIAPEPVGRYVARTMPRADLVLLDATGHCPNLSAPEATIDAIRAWL